MTNNPRGNRQDNPDDVNNNSRDDGYYTSGYDDASEEYNDSDFAPSQDDTPTQVIYPDLPPEDTERGYDDLDVDDYDFTFDRELRDNLKMYHPSNIPGEVTSGNWVTLGYYDDLYYNYSDMAEKSIEIISEYKKAYDDAFDRNVQLENLNRELDNQAIQASMREKYSGTNVDEREADLANAEDAFERKKAQEKWLKIALATAAIILAILSIVLGLMLLNANSNADSSNKRGDAHQARITELEESVNNANNSVNDLTNENNDLKGKMQGLNTRVKTAEDLAESKSKELDSKNQEIAGLNDKVKELENREPSTVTQTVEPSTVTETATLPGVTESNSATITETVTETATAAPTE